MQRKWLIVLPPGLLVLGAGVLGFVLNTGTTGKRIADALSLMSFTAAGALLLTVGFGEAMAQIEAKKAARASLIWRWPLMTLLQLLLMVLVFAAPNRFNEFGVDTGRDDTSDLPGGFAGAMAGFIGLLVLGLILRYVAS